MEELRILVVADAPLARAGLAALLETRPDCTVVGQVAAPDGQRADLSDAVDVYRPDVILWDLGWDPDRSLGQGMDLEGIEASADLQPPIVALLPDETHAADAWAAGVRGLLLREAPVEALTAALQAVAQRLAVLDLALAAAALPAREQSPERLAEELTPRELEVLQLLAEGLSNKAIAHRLEISEHTVKFHVNAILGKLGAQSRATRLGLIIL